MPSDHIIGIERAINSFQRFEDAWGEDLVREMIAGLLLWHELNVHDPDRANERRDEVVKRLLDEAAGRYRKLRKRYIEPRRPRRRNRIQVSARTVIMDDSEPQFEVRDIPDGPFDPSTWVMSSFEMPRYAASDEEVENDEDIPF